MRATQNNGERPTTSPFTPTTANGRASANNAPAINVNGPLAADGEWDFDCVDQFLESYEAQAEALANHMHEAYHDAIMCPSCGQCLLAHEVKKLRDHYKWVTQNHTDMACWKEQIWNRCFVRTRQNKNGEHQVQMCTKCAAGDNRQADHALGLDPRYTPIYAKLNFSALSRLGFLTPRIKFSRQTDAMSYASAQGTIAGLNIDAGMPGPMIYNDHNNLNINIPFLNGLLNFLKQSNPLYNQYVCVHDALQNANNNNGNPPQVGIPFIPTTTIPAIAQAQARAVTAGQSQHPINPTHACAINHHIHLLTHAPGTLPSPNLPIGIATTLHGTTDHIHLYNENPNSCPLEVALFPYMFVNNMIRSFGAWTAQRIIILLNIYQHRRNALPTT